MERCPNCNAKIKSSAFSVNKLMSKECTDFVNRFLEEKSEMYCESCIGQLYTQALHNLSSRKSQLTNQVQSLISAIPIISTHSPLNWDYDIIDLVTGQSTSGTGVVTEFVSSISDFFGNESHRHNSKLKECEEACKVQLQYQAYKMGGNAIIATDIDYNELGGGRGILMVCMTGTVIKVKNQEILGADRVEKLKELELTLKEFQDLDNIRRPDMETQEHAS